MFRLLRIITTIFLLLQGNPVFAAPPSNIPAQRFLPLPAPKVSPRSQMPMSDQSVKFFPLTQSRFPMPIHRDAEKKEVVNAVIKDDFSPQIPEKNVSREISNNKSSVSPKQAQQILSLFATTQ